MGSVCGRLGKGLGKVWEGCGKVWGEFGKGLGRVGGEYFQATDQNEVGPADQAQCLNNFEAIIKQYRSIGAPMMEDGADDACKPV